MSGGWELDFRSIIAWLLPCTVWLRIYNLKRFLVVSTAGDNLCA
jgi:hypothetical protein